MTGPLRLGLIGLGDFGLEHLVGALADDDFEVVAVADPRREHTDAIADRHGIAHRFADGIALLRAVPVDAVAVVSPSPTHLLLAEEAVQRGAAVLLEKPVVAELAEAARLLELDEQGLVVPAHILRSGAPYIETHREVAGGGLRIGGLSARRHRPIDHLTRFPGGDPVFMSMVHDIDLAIWFTGSRAVTVRARAHAIRDPGRIDTVLASIVDDLGRTWDIGSSWTIEESGPSDRFELYTDRGLHMVDGNELDAQEAMRSQYRRFAVAITGGANPVPVSEAVHGIAIAEAVLRSAREGGTEVAVASTEEIRRMADTAR